MDQQLPQQPNSSQPKADDEITLKDTILKIQELWGIVWPYRARITTISLFIGLCSSPIYAWNRTFVVGMAVVKPVQFYFKYNPIDLSGR